LSVISEGFRGEEEEGKNLKVFDSQDELLNEFRDVDWWYLSPRVAPLIDESPQYQEGCQEPEKSEMHLSS